MEEVPIYAAIRLSNNFTHCRHYSCIFYGMLSCQECNVAEFRIELESLTRDASPSITTRSYLQKQFVIYVL